jgi:hypothetical protein
MNAKLPYDVRLVKFHGLDRNIELPDNLLCRSALRTTKPKSFVVDR